MGFTILCDIGSAHLFGTGAQSTLRERSKMSRLKLHCSLLLLSVSTAAWAAQSPCPTQEVLGSAAKRSSDLVCIVPQVYGPGGLVGVDNGGPLAATEFHEVHFQAASINSFGPINAEIGVQLSQVPLASPVSGFIFANGVMQEATSFGPVLADRAETLGRRKVFVGASYEYFNFDKADECQPQIVWRCFPA